MLTQDEVNAKGRAVQDACLFKQSESRKRFSAFVRVFKQEGTKKNGWNLKKRSLNEGMGANQNVVLIL